MYCNSVRLWVVSLSAFMMLILVSRSQIIKSSFNRTKAINDEYKAINNIRRSHSTPDLKVDTGLCQRANDHVNAIAGILFLQHCDSFVQTEVGETMAYIYKPPNTAYFGG